MDTELPDKSKIKLIATGKFDIFKFHKKKINKIKRKKN